MFSFLYLIPVCFEGNLVDHISGKYKLTWCCLQCCMIGASNSLVTMHLIEGRNQVEYFLLLLDFHDCFASQMIWAYQWRPTSLCTRSMIVLACRLMVVTFIWFGFNAIIVFRTHLFELTFEFTHFPIVKNNKLRSRVTSQPSVMKQILDGCCWLILALTISNQPVLCCYIYHIECKKRVCFGWCPYCKWNHQIHTNHDPGIQCQILLFWMRSATHISYAPSLSYDILESGT
jgi:hypothetical protein